MKSKGEVTVEVSSRSELSRCAGGDLALFVVVAIIIILFILRIHNNQRIIFIVSK